MELTAGESVFCRARFSLSLCSVVESASKQRRVPEPCDHHVRGVARARLARRTTRIYCIWIHSTIEDCRAQNDDRIDGWALVSHTSNGEKRGKGSSARRVAATNVRRRTALRMGRLRRRLRVSDIPPTPRNIIGAIGSEAPARARLYS